jgi:membrane-associated PAP2 superfamily phosphatase
MAYLTISTVMTIIGFQCPWIVIQFGWLVAWIYLRFYKRNTGDVVGGGDAYGDRSETFAFIYWFPPFAQ